MLIQTDPPLHLTYCLNIHAGETWDANFAAIRDKATVVRDKVAPGKTFGLGLRLSCQAAEQLREGTHLAELRRFLDDNGLYAFTINGFPYGTFHGTAVKADVYQPDWRTPERRDYTVLLADILAELLPEGVPGSISTVPCSYKPWITTEADVTTMAENLADVAKRLDEIREQTGRDICIALEPEPDCFLETTDEMIRFLTDTLPAVGVPRLSNRGLTEEKAGGVLRRHITVCLDTAHAAVEFEDPVDCVRRYLNAGVAIGKVQLSAALSLKPEAGNLERLIPFRDPVYLHQSKAAHSGAVTHFPDLPEALAAPEAKDWDELRVHFHVPLFFDSFQGLTSTSRQLVGDFACELRNGATPHVEIETYTFDVLPPELRRLDVTDSIANEYNWVLTELFPDALSSC